ncbi:MAG TPA: DoxX family protein [Caulobacteraceae bacterium]|nr:DoxX family protein [Caulobacteraceae bacterium]
MDALNAWAPRIRSLLRIVVALLFIEHGTMKMFHFPAPLMPGPLPPILVLAGWIELVGGVLILLGLFTRAAAFVCSGETAVAYFIFHFPKGFWPALNMGGEAILFCWIFFYLIFAGAGPWSLDALLRKKPEQPRVAT